MSNNKQSSEYKYEVKCRKCNKLNTMYFGDSNTTDKKTFLLWIREHITFPIEKQCNCNNGMILFHDIVGYNIILFE